MKIKNLFIICSAVVITSVLCSFLCTVSINFANNPGIYLVRITQAKSIYDSHTQKSFSLGKSQESYYPTYVLPFYTKRGRLNYAICVILGMSIATYFAVKSVGVICCKKREQSQENITRNDADHENTNHDNS